MTVLQVVQVINNISALLLALVGFHAFALSIVYLWHRHKKLATVSQPEAEGWPVVVVQLPIYNERHVVDSLVEAISRLDYPKDRLQVQLLDDSTDETVGIASAAVERARQTGLAISHIRRGTREGYKAGALIAGLEKTDAPFVAIFDADFVPNPDFLKRTVPYLLSNDQLGMVQTRWAHLNAGTSLLTRAEALALDNHFVVEQTARNRAGLLMNFSGTAGVWRRTTIEDSGGWDGSTLSEDIDLSYRAQLKGWECLYLPDIGAPAEIAPLMMGFKKQQARWATGTMQCLRKLGPTVLRSDLTIWQKIEAMFHLSAYLIHPLMIILLLTTLPLALEMRANPISLAGLGLAMFGPPLQTLISQRSLYPDWKHRLAYFPMLMLLGVGIAVSNSEAVIRGLVQNRVVFQRTPKFRVDEKGSHNWVTSAYTVPVDYSLLLEILLGIYATITTTVLLQAQPGLATFMLLYALGFGYVAGLSLWQTGAIRLELRRRLQLSDNKL